MDVQEASDLLWFKAHAHLSQLTAAGYFVRVWHLGDSGPPVEALAPTFAAAVRQCREAANA